MTIANKTAKSMKAKLLKRYRRSAIVRKRVDRLIKERNLKRRYCEYLIKDCAELAKRNITTLTLAEISDYQYKMQLITDSMQNDIKVRTMFYKYRHTKN